MDLSAKELAAVAAIGGPIAGFLAAWLWNRFWKNKDDKKKKDESKVDALANTVAEVVRRVEAVDAGAKANAVVQGGIEANLNRLDGKVDGLQKHWTSRFDKLSDEFKELEGKVEYKLDNLRLELRGDSQKQEERLSKMLSDHQTRIHDRLNAISAEQAKMLSEMVDLLVDKAGEPRPSPALPKVD